MNSASWVSWFLELTTGGDIKALIRFRLFNTHNSVCLHVRYRPAAQGVLVGALKAACAWVSSATESHF